MSKRESRRLQGQRLAAPIRIVIAPTASGRKWVSSLNDKTLCISASPLVMASRLLIAQRFDPNGIIEMWHRHADPWALRGRLGAVAAVIIDGEKKPTQPAKNGPPVQFSGEPNGAARNGQPISPRGVVEWRQTERKPARVMSQRGFLALKGAPG
jgi:hypothetical protein